MCVFYPINYSNNQEIAILSSQKNIDLLPEAGETVI